MIMEDLKGKIALIGAGYWGKNILRNLYELGFIHSVYDASPKRRLELSEKYPDIRFVDDMEQILGNSEVVGVCIATPAVTHYEVAKKALLAGKHVFVEKPLSIRVEEAEELIKISDEQKKILMVGHILNYHPAIKKMKEMISGGEIGRIFYIYSNRLNIGKLRTEENIIWSFAPHDVSVILNLIGEEPERVSATGGYYITPDVFDVTLMDFTFKNNIRGHIFVSWLHPFKEQKLVVVGSEAMLLFDDLTEEKLFLYPHKIKWIEGKIPVAEKAEREAIPIEKKEPLKEEMLQFAESILTGGPPYTDGREGLRVLRILNEAEKSVRAHQ